MVLCIGHAAWDLLYPLESFPEEDAKYIVPAIVESPGGPACNAAFLLGQWGVPAALVATLGEDPYAAAIIRQLGDWGVDTAWLRPDPAVHTPISVVMVNRASGSRTILTHKNQKEPLALPGGLAEGLRPSVILYDGHETQAALDAIRLFPEALAVFDGGSLRPLWRELLARTDCAIVSERYAAQVLGLQRISSDSEAAHCLRVLRSLGSGAVAVTRGEKGCLAMDSGSDLPFAVAPFPARTLDSNAAGDIFHGAFCAAMAGAVGGDDGPVGPGAIVSFAEALEIASAAASVSVERPGGRDSIPTREETLARLGRR